MKINRNALWVNGPPVVLINTITSVPRFQYRFDRQVTAEISLRLFHFYAVAVVNWVGASAAHSRRMENSTPSWD
jgi:hypothetical protein